MDDNRRWRNLINTNMAKLEFPELDTYFIAWNNERTEIQSNGLILTTQVMETLLNEVDYYTNENEYDIVLTNNKIDIYQ